MAITPTKIPKEQYGYWLPIALELLEKMVDGVEGYVGERGDAGPYWFDKDAVAAREFLDTLGVPRRG